MDPHLQGVSHQHAVRSLTGFAGVARIRYFDHGRKVQGDTVSDALTAIGKKFTMVQKEEPTK